MFSGIIEEPAKVEALELNGRSARITITSGLDHSQSKVGDSIAIDGVCLTVVEKRGGTLVFDVSSETFRRSTLPELKPGQKVNLERALKLGDRIHGHLVAGHVDATVRLLEMRQEDKTSVLTWELPREQAHLIAPKGSIALSGISLTVGEVESDRFNVFVIPHTGAATTLNSWQVGRLANLEVDVLARYVQRVMTNSSEARDERLSALIKANFPDQK